MVSRSVNGIPLEKIKEAFEVMCKDSENYMSMGKAEFLEALAYKGIKCFGGLVVCWWYLEGLFVVLLTGLKGQKLVQQN